MRVCGNPKRRLAQRNNPRQLDREIAIDAVYGSLICEC